MEQVDISKIDLNTGQIEGLPKNPRFIKDGSFKQLVKSIQDDPEMLELRELIVFPKDGRYITIAGNMRLKAMQELNYKTAPCKVLAEDTPPEKLRAYSIKDNIATYGENDWEALANEWDDEELKGWGMELEYSKEDFSPTDGDEQPRLDEKAKVKCPECGNEFAP